MLQHVMSSADALQVACRQVASCWDIWEKIIGVLYSKLKESVSPFCWLLKKSSLEYQWKHFLASFPDADALQVACRQVASCWDIWEKIIGVLYSKLKESVSPFCWLLKKSSLEYQWKHFLASFPYFFSLVQRSQYTCFTHLSCFFWV